MHPGRRAIPAAAEAQRQRAARWRGPQRRSRRTAAWPACGWLPRTAGAPPDIAVTPGCLQAAPDGARIRARAAPAGPLRRQRPAQHDAAPSIPCTPASPACVRRRRRCSAPRRAASPRDHPASAAPSVRTPAATGRRREHRRANRGHLRSARRRPAPARPTARPPLASAMRLCCYCDAVSSRALPNAHLLPAPHGRRTCTADSAAHPLR